MNSRISASGEDWREQAANASAMTAQSQAGSISVELGDHNVMLPPSTGLQSMIGLFVIFPSKRNAYESSI
jgi:hypothetical protein